MSSPDQTTNSKHSRLEQGSFGELIPVQAAAFLPEPVGPTCCSECGAWPATKRDTGTLCNGCDDRRWAKLHPVPLPADRKEPRQETGGAALLLAPGDQFGLATIKIDVDADGHLLSGPDYEYQPSKLETVGVALLGLAKTEEERQPIIELLARFRQYDNVRLTVTGPGADAFTKLITEAKP